MLSWLSVDARTGVVNSYLPDLSPQGPCAVTIGRYESLGHTLPLPAVILAVGDSPTPAALAALADFKAATNPGSSVLVALDEQGNPTWGGLVLTRTRDHTGAVTLSTVTMEAYLDRRYTGTYTTDPTGIGATRDQNLIVSDLIGQFIADGVLPGIPIRVATTASATALVQSYNAYDDHTVYSTMQTLSGGLNGPQWTVGWEWNTPTGAGQQRITPVLTVADRLGAAPTTQYPAAVFSMPGCIAQFQLVEDYSAGNGANRVTATGAGQGIARSQDVEVATNYAGRPTFEYRYAPSTTIINNLSLQQHAQRVLAAIGNGTSALTMTVEINTDSSGNFTMPMLGIDCSLGDTVGYDIMAPAFIDGSMLNRNATMYGWQRDDTTFTPILVNPATNIGSL